MAYYFSPIGNSQQLATSGAPLNAGTITTFLAGTSTPAATYTDNAGGNPSVSLTLNTYGLPSSPVWLLGGQAIKFVIKDSLGNTIRTLDNVSGVNDLSAVAAADQWVAFTGTLTYISATSFSVTGNQTATLQVGRRVKTTNTGGTAYSTIATSVFGSVTTVTLVNDSTTLDSGLSALSYGLLSVLNPSAPTLTTLNLATVQATTSGTSIDFTAIPSWVKRITVSLSGVSTNGTSNPVIQIGDGTVRTSGYVGSFTGGGNAASPSVTLMSAGFQIGSGSASNVIEGQMVLTLLDPATFKWSAVGNFGHSAVAASYYLLAGTKTLSGALDRIRLTTVLGVDAFDAGAVNILYE